MKKEISYRLGFADGELTAYFRESEVLTVRVKTWNEKSISVQFMNVAGVADYGLGDISSFVEEVDGSEFFQKVLNEVYESVPDTHPYRLFQFLNQDGTPRLEIVAVGQSVPEP